MFIKILRYGNINKYLGQNDDAERCDLKFIEK